MKILVRDRIKGVNSSNVQLASYGPGNITDDSTRNVWISGSPQDSLDVECESQLKALFLGNVRADSITYSHFRSEIQPTYAYYKNEGTNERANKRTNEPGISKIQRNNGKFCRMV